MNKREYGCMGTWIHPTRLEIVFSGTSPVGLAGIHHDEGMVSREECCKLDQVNCAKVKYSDYEYI